MARLRFPLALLGSLAITAALAGPLLAAEASPSPSAGRPIASPAGGVEGEAPGIEDVTWRLSRQWVDDAWMDVPDDVVVTLTLGDGQAGGNGGCNSYFADYELEGDDLSFGRIGSTLMACAGPGGDVETRYFANLEEVAGWTLDGSVLTLEDASGQAILEFEAAPAVSIVGSWVAQGINDGNEAVVSSAMTSSVTADFDADGRLSGSDGCNRYFTTYTLEGDGISVSPDIASTRRACAEDVMEQAEQYYAALTSASTWSIDPSGDLELRDEDGALQAHFTPAPS